MRSRKRAKILRSPDVNRRCVMPRDFKVSSQTSHILRFTQVDSRQKSARRRNNRSGIALIWIAILGMVLVGLAGLALDTGYVMLTGHQLQNAADAAALAGANSVSFDTT